MARKPALRNLYFVRMALLVGDSAGIVFLFTAPNEEQASQMALDKVNPVYRHMYKVDKVEFVCLTPNDVDGFEPV